MVEYLVVLTTCMTRQISQYFPELHCQNIIVGINDGQLFPLCLKIIVLKWSFYHRCYVYEHDKILHVHNIAFLFVIQIDMVTFTHSNLIKFEKYL